MPSSPNNLLYSLKVWGVGLVLGSGKVRWKAAVVVMDKVSEATEGLKHFYSLHSNFPLPISGY